MRLIYVTLPDLEEAQALTRKLLERRLAACTNIFPRMVSSYWWEGKITHEEECAMIVKTHDDRVKEAIDFIASEHSYSTPCAISLPVEGGHPPYLDWIEKETRNE